MLKIRPALVRVVLVATVFMLLGTQLISPVRADASSGWLSQADFALSKTSELPANQSPGVSNRDCTQQDYNLVGSNGSTTVKSGCLGDSTLGKMGLYGSPILFAGTSQAVPITPDYPYLLQPIPNQGMMLSLTSAQVIGSYLHFYTDIRQDITANTTITGQLTGYTVTKEPDFDLRDKNNNRIPVNATGTLSYSSNGSWMLVESPHLGFLRVNMATFDVLPFASPLNNGPNDYSNRTGVTAISDDGKYAAIASNDYGYVRVYDLTTCTGTIQNNYSPLNCQFRNYGPGITGKLNAFKAIYRVRFVNDDNLSITASYNFVSGTSYNVAKYTLTAPGKLAHSLDYMAIGDSYISGEGEFDYKSGTDDSNNKCHLSPLAYPYLIGADLFNQYNSIACSGAKIKDITSLGIKDYDTDPNGSQWHGKPASSYDEEIYDQFEPGYRTQESFIERYQPSTVTLSIGGNNIGFADIVTQCVEKSLKLRADCFSSYDERMNLVKKVVGLYPDLQDTYRKIVAADPGVQLYVVGYPQVIAPMTMLNSCSLNMPLTQHDILFAQQLINYLDTTIEQAANSVGVRYVDIQHALDGHKLCEAKSSSVAVNGVTAGNDSGPLGLKLIGDESFHPNVLGHQLIAQEILRQTSNMHQGMPASQAVTSPTASDSLAQAFLGGYPPTTTKFPQIIQVANTVGSTFQIGQTSSLSVDGQARSLVPGKAYQVAATNYDAPPTILSTVQADANGNLQIPINLGQGFVLGDHTIQITGVNQAGQTVELDMPILVIASSDDADGDGVPDTQEACGILPASGTDSDGDGIDDTCDPVIGDVPSQNPLAKVYLKNNTVLITRP